MSVRVCACVCESFYQCFVTDFNFSVCVGVGSPFTSVLEVILMSVSIEVL